jgi:3,4-dihydroxy 2-butanone 4-phosphate synthase/GTP cyclohydrolase II
LRPEAHALHHHTAFTLSVDARHGIKTGISACDRAHTIAVTIDSKSTPHDLIVPGHIFPLRAQEGGVLVRPGHTEAAVDLARLAGLNPAGVICEVMADDGEMLRGDDLKRFAEQHQLPTISVEALIAYLRERPLTTVPVLPHSAKVTIAGEANIITEFGPFTCLSFFANPDPHEHVALIAGDLTKIEEPHVRVHSECLTGDVFGSEQCDCGAQKDFAMKDIAKHGGIFVYLRQEGRGIGLTNKLRAYAKQHHHDLDTVEANLAIGLPVDSRNYRPAGLLLQHLGVTHCKLLTNNPDKLTALTPYVDTVVREPIIIEAGPHNQKYLQTKATKLGHWLKPS